MADIIDTVNMAFIPIVVCHCKPTKLKNHTSTSTLSITSGVTSDFILNSN